MTENEYQIERERIRHHIGRNKVTMVRNAIKKVAIAFNRHFTVGECMDEFVCSYATALRAYKEIFDDPAYHVERRVMSEPGMPRYIVSLRLVPH